MNCQEFEAGVVDIIRGEAGSPAQAAASHAHAEGCARCAALLAEQKNLALGFEALAGELEDARAPERVEAALLSAFRNRNFVAGRPTAPPWRRPNSGWVKGIFGSRLAWAMAAAVVVATVGIVMAERHRAKTNAVSGMGDESQAQTSPAINSGAPRQATMAKARPEASNTHLARAQTTAGNRTRHHALPHSRRAPAPALNGENERVTAFYPLPYGSGLGLDQGWEMVRVKMPVSALASLGVPVADEPSAARLVKADVVLGQDGTARAIRFVQ